MEIIVKTKEWGNSIGILLPSNIVKQKMIKPGEDIIISIEKKHNVLKDLFGSLKFKKPTEQLIKEFRKDLDSKWIK